jgi:fructose-1,6-bisphosphatase/inositol monophosphatase family enzyme
LNILIKCNFNNIISEEHSSNLLKENSYLTIDPIDGTRNFINGVNKVVIMVSYIENESSIFSIIYDPVEDLFYHTHNNLIYKNFIEIKYSKYEEHIGFLGDHAKIYFKDYVSNPIEKKRSRSIGYDVLEVLEGKRSFMTIYGSKIWDLFPAMSFLKILNFKTNLPNMNFDYAKLDEKIIFYAEL